MAVNSNTEMGAPLSDAKPLTPSPLLKPKSIFLHEWWLVKPQQQRGGLAVGGVTFMERERVFLSTVIAKRLEANVLETEDGITVSFRGFINTSRTCENGFPSVVCHHFLIGFPHDWKKYSAHSLGDEHIINEVLDFAVENQTGNPESSQSLMAVSEPDSCAGLSGKILVKSPISTKKLKKDQSPSDCKEKQCNRQKMVENTDDSCNRRITRSISKRSHTILKSDKKCVGSPVRRSLRLCNRKK
ncbi:SANT associated [Sesbania bispinosa]|nr:SANT associated [Sesbania bispinosa]